MIKMIAAKTVYRQSERKEYRPGASFDVADEREADKLERARKARRVPDKPKHVDVPKHTKVEEPDEAPKKSGGRGRYQRRDMTATDGQTGEEIPLPSSLLDPPSEESTSPNSEAEQE